MADLNQSHVEASAGAQTDRKCGMDMNYVKSINGILKAKMIGWSFLAFLLCVFSGVSVTNIFFGIVVFSGLMLSIGFFIIFAFSKDRQITRINVYSYDLLVSAAGTILYFIVCMAMVFNILYPVMVAAAVFGFIAMLSFGASIWYNFKRWRQSKSITRSSDQAYETNY